MSTVARPALDLRAARSSDWAPWAILCSDVVALETAFALGLVVRRLLAPLFVYGIGRDNTPRWPSRCS